MLREPCSGSNTTASFPAASCPAVAAAAALPACTTTGSSSSSDASTPTTPLAARTSFSTSFCAEHGETGRVQETSVNTLFSCRVACRVKWEKCRGALTCRHYVQLFGRCSRSCQIQTACFMPDPALHPLCTFPPCTVDSPLPPTIDARCGARAHAPLHCLWWSIACGILVSWRAGREGAAFMARLACWPRATGF